MACPAWTFYYDGECGLCVSLVGRLRKLDTRRRIEWRAAQSIAEPPAGLTWDDLERSAYLECRPGELFEGFFAIRKLLTVLPALCAVGALMYLPGVSLIGVPVYRLVADRRGSVTGCSRGDR